MESVSFVNLYSDPEYTATLKSAWGIVSEELAPVALKNLDSLNSKELRGLHKRTAWAHHAIQEFQDLQFMPIGKGAQPYPNNANYLFHEGLLILRECVTSGLNNSLHASLSLLRSVIEVFLFDAWWKARLETEGDWRRFDSWLSGAWNPPPFKNILTDVYKELQFPPVALKEEAAADTYASLCSYTHKPLPRQSLARLRGTNRPVQSQCAIESWFYALYVVSGIVLDLLIAEYPMSLFPVCVYKKFGFNPPIGCFFDKVNFVPLRRALPEVIHKYKAFYEGHQTVIDLQSFYKQQPDRSTDEILQSWDGEVPEYETQDTPVDVKIERRWCLMKAKIRAFSWGFAYADARRSPIASAILQQVRKPAVQ